MQQKKILKEFLDNRGNLLEIIIVAILLGLGIEFCASSLYSNSKVDVPHKNLYFFIIGALLCLLSLVFFFIKFFGVKKISKTVNGFFILNKETNKLVSIDNYDFLWSLNDFLSAAMAEDKAIKIDWEDASFSYDGAETKKQNGIQIINELTEYYVLETMSTHLTDFFNHHEIDKNELIELNRNDIHTVLLSNRFLELISKPMNQRAAFKNDNKKASSGKIISSYSAGVMFRHFDLVLPKDSKLSKDKNGFITLKTKRFTLKYKANYEGYDSVLPLGYMKHYLKINERDKYTERQVSIHFEFELKFGALLLPNGWNYYNWIDSLLSKIDNKISKKKYFKKIGWKKAYVVIKSMTN